MILKRHQQDTFQYKKIETLLRVDINTVPVSQTEERRYRRAGQEEEEAAGVFCLWSHFAHSHLSETHSLSAHPLTLLMLTGCSRDTVSSPACVWVFECGGKAKVV